MEEKLEIVQRTEILGKEINLYGSIENPRFLATEVAEWIGYCKTGAGKFNVAVMIKNIDDCDKGTNIVGTLGGEQKAMFLTENGLYEVLMTSRKPIAKDLKKQIKEYLHNIRTTGAAFEEGREEEAIEKYFPSFSEEVKMAMVQDLRAQNEKLKADKAQLETDNKALTGSILEWGDRKKIGAAICKLAGVAGIPYGTVWNQLYTNLQYKYSIDLRKRGTRKPPFIQYVREDEWDKVLQSFSAICEVNHLSPTDMFQNIRMEAATT